MATALVVEDSGPLRALIEAVLKERGYERVLVVTSATEAIALVRELSGASLQELEVAVLDYDLADGRSRGAEVALELRVRALQELLQRFKPWIVGLSSNKPEERGLYDRFLLKGEVSIPALKQALVRHPPRGST